MGPSNPSGAKIQDVKFIDDEMGWMLWMTNNTDGSSNFTLAQTSNQGQDWDIQSLNLFDVGDVTAHSEKAGMGWLDAQTGWIAVKQATGSNFSVGTLFTTSDGGFTWSRSALPVADNLIFSEPQIGWAVGGPTGGQIFRTQNGGVSWHEVTPPLTPNTFTMAYKPYYSGGQSLLVTTNLGLENSVKVYAYENSTDEWSFVNQVILSVEPGVIPLSILDAQNFVAVIPGTKSIVQMMDGGLGTFENKDGLSASIVGLDMVSMDAGWAKSVDSDCVTASSLTDQSASVTCSSTTRLLQTTDGGLTWQRVPLPDIQSETNSFSILGTDNVTTLSTVTGPGNTNVFTGQGFDKCEIPSISQLQTWWSSSPYKTVNFIYWGI